MYDDYYDDDYDDDDEYDDPACTDLRCHVCGGAVERHGENVCCTVCDWAIPFAGTNCLDCGTPTQYVASRDRWECPSCGQGYTPLLNAPPMKTARQAEQWTRMFMQVRDENPKLSLKLVMAVTKRILTHHGGAR